MPRNSGLQPPPKPEDYTRILNEFPGLMKHEWDIRSRQTKTHNCIAYAAGSEDRPWWPVPAWVRIAYWPPGVPREENIPSFIQAFETLGYQVCESGDLEAGYQKIVIYANSMGVPSHAAIQTPSGTWKSKLGDWEDIEHATPDALNGRRYGFPVQYMKRAIGQKASGSHTIGKKRPRKSG